MLDAWILNLQVRWLSSHYLKFKNKGVGMTKLLIFLSILLALIIVGGGGFLMFWDIPAPVTILDYRLSVPAPEVRY